MTATHADAAPLPLYVQRFFTDRLMGQMQASPNTVASYRDTFRLLLRFAAVDRGVEPTDLTLAHLDVTLVGRFLTDCEARRGNSARSRNTRLAAIRSFFRYVALSERQLLLHCQQIVAMPAKRYVRRPVDFLASDEIAALLAAPDTCGWFGRRDRTLLLVAIQTGLRVSEETGLRWQDVELGTGAHVRCVGKGRKARATPLRPDSRDALEAWAEETGGATDAPVFAGRAGRPLSRDAVERLVRKHALMAARSCPSFSAKRITPHVLRHTAAMQLLQAGVDRTVIALWLGHESVDTTQVYVHADIELKERAMARTRTTDAMVGRYRPPDDLLGFLEAL